MRLWGYWTKGKLDILERYLDAFTTTTKHKASERIYIDAFAGEPDNRDRLTGEPIAGSAKIALSVDDPPFTRLRFFETEANAPRLETLLRSDCPNRDVKVIGGNCNERLPQELALLQHFNWAPTFAFIDPNGLEAEWRTLEHLARFKRRQKYKVEIFYYFTPPMFMRMLPVAGQPVREENMETIDCMYGTKDWYHIYQARLHGRLQPSQAREEYLNLMRWRLQEVLGYEWTHPIELRNERGRVIYYRIFATDHPAGDRIMRSIYSKAANEFPDMMIEARRIRRQEADEKAGIKSLFGEDDAELWQPIQPDEQFYEYEPPTKPWFLK